MMFFPGGLTDSFLPVSPSSPIALGARGPSVPCSIFCLSHLGAPGGPCSPFLPVTPSWPSQPDSQYNDVSVHVIDNLLCLTRNRRVLHTPAIVTSTFKPV